MYLFTGALYAIMSKLYLNLEIAEEADNVVAT